MEATHPTQSESSPTKHVRRRGRPRIKSSMESETVMARRARNRQAQNVYRVRREAAQKQQTLRLQQLEHAIEEMSSTIEAFTREMLSSRIVEQHRELLLPLRKMTTTILALATGADGVRSPSPDNVLQSPKNEMKDDKYEHRASHSENISFITTPPSASSEEQHLIDKAISTHHAGTQHERRIMALASSQSRSSASDISNEQMEQWLSGVREPLELEFMPQLPLESLTYRLVYSSLLTALTALTQPNHSIEPLLEECRIFGTVVPGTRRANLISHYKWLLGPGTASLYDCAKLSFIPNQTPSSLKQHTMSVQSEQLSFLSVVDIESRLVALGARNRYQDFIEIEIENPNKPKEDMGQHFLSHWAVGNFDPFDVGPPKTTNMTIHICLSLLIANLAKCAVCLGRGPAFPVHDLGAAIEASVVAAHGGLDGD
ncbi:hypothetical protein BFJ63_vAg17920 [Fusarium oxysporum f. sp. narcissi]|uniref:BZIP domain-containing protein n=6 Tax=Fusarium oxysporum TaxID=5507 RepID=F9GD63_FUSOF|nr:hypothetical protein FOXB_16597 [Fusarium oxysporum f. sp. conglutinans Fo5176]EXA28460.1 hypothetical protein FOVG_19936 [Fusarium oxysporum f. sp. pisi HDV247]KAH7190756.1 hypothetical protein DER44DRAFT_753041 [Fusarium oxysporum]KAH7471785.1 hypothetical protein FOMA001_g13171 [Fusarium oxysporum f. sp. matthiolae]RKK11924.1 hypothetical protein BFJ65_g13800 [Fusarium oxysporum f. sp. cepae]RYC79201.1 hypothetical protein BFJ63_vAg17920 [Fusarium oxysporum f. sp. narcissi]